MSLILLTADVELSDSPARDKTFPVGIFDGREAVEEAKGVFKARFRGNRVWFKEYPASVNQIIPIVP